MYLSPQKKEMSETLIGIEKMGLFFSVFRLSSPARIAAMERSLSCLGQLHPVIVRCQGGIYELLDGFKRFHAARSLGWEELSCRVVEADNISAKVMILLYNSTPGSLQDYEQARIVHSLKHEHLLSGQDIARLTGKSLSWVSRRLSFIERLDESAGTQLELGGITATHARELSRLPRGKQEAFLRLIIGENLTSRETGLLARKYLSARTPREEKYLLAHPREILERALMEGDLFDSRLSVRGNRLLKTSRLLIYQQHTFIGQGSNPPLEELSPVEKEVLFPGFCSIASNAKKIQSLLKPYHHER